MKNQKSNQFKKGLRDAKSDLAGNWVTAKELKDVDHITSHLKAMVGASDEYIKGYLSVAFGRYGARIVRKLS